MTAGANVSLDPRLYGHQKA